MWSVQVGLPSLSYFSEISPNVGLQQINPAQFQVSNPRHCQPHSIPPNSPTTMTKQFYITTAIDYVNGQPHLGHAYEKVVADVIARAQRSLGNEVFFLTGLDEHGQKVQQTALKEGKKPQAYCDEL